MTSPPRPYSLIKNSFYVFLIRGVGAVLTLGLSILISRELGATEAGLVFLAWSLLTICSILARNGFENTVVRFVSIEQSHQHTSAINKIDQHCTQTILKRAIIITTVMVILSPLLADYLFDNPALTQPLLISSLAIFPLTLITIKAEVLRGLKQITLSNFLNGVSTNAVAMLLIITLLLFGLVSGANMVTTLYLCATGVVAVISYLALKSHLGMEMTTADDHQALIDQLTHAAKPMLYIALLDIAIKSTDIILIGIYLTSDQVAIYKIASQFAIMITFLLVAVNSAIAPQLAELHANNQHQQLARTMQKNTLTMLIITTPVLIIYLLFAEPLLAIAGEEFIEGTLPLMILAFGFFINVITGSVGNLLIMTGHERILRNNIIVFFIINLALNTLLIPLFGIVGAAVATAFSIAAMNLITAFFVYKYLNINVYDYCSLIRTKP